VTSGVVVAPLEAAQAPLLARPFYAGGDPGPIAATLAHVPELMEVALPFLGVALSPSSIDWRTKEIVIVRTSALLSCRYCVDSHTPVALDSGLTPTEVHALRDESEIAAAFSSQRDLALLGWTDELAIGRGSVSAAVTDAMTAHFADHEIVELTVLVGATMLLNRFATALRLPVSPETLVRLAAEGFEPTP